MSFKWESQESGRAILHQRPEIREIRCQRKPMTRLGLSLSKRVGGEQIMRFHRCIARTNRSKTAMFINVRLTTRRFGAIAPVREKKLFKFPIHRWDAMRKTARIARVD